MRITKITAGNGARANLSPPSLSEQEASDAAKGLPDEIWFACREPERPPDEYIAYHYCCPACLIHVEAAGDNPQLSDGGTLIEMMITRLNEHGPAPEAIPWRNRG